MLGWGPALGVALAGCHAYAAVYFALRRRHALDAEPHMLLEASAYTLASALWAAAELLVPEFARPIGFVLMSFSFMPLAGGLSRRSALLPIGIGVLLTLCIRFDTPAQLALRGALAAAVVAVVLIAHRPSIERESSNLSRSLAFWGLAVAYLHDAFAAFGLSEWVLLTPALALLTVMTRAMDGAGHLGRLEKRLALQERELFEQATALRRLEVAHRRRRGRAATGELAAVVAHEVRNPLAVIRNATSSMRKSTVVAEDRAMLAAIVVEEVDRLHQLTEQMNAFARPVRRSNERVELDRLVGRVARNTVSPGAGVEVVLVLESCVVLGDPEQLRRAFVNLLENALAFSPPGSRVRVLASSSSGRPVLQVEDQGPGMSAKVASHAHEPFFTTRTTGTGLGLAIVDRIITLHGGRLELTSSVGKGTIAKLVFPEQVWP